MNVQESYISARAEFIKQAKKAGAAIEEYEVSIRGADNEELYVDVAYLGSLTSDKILVINSGTHGVEGYAGSAIQIELLKKNIITGRQSVSILLIHALNPYGFSFKRRVNERNIDINRNFIDFGLQGYENNNYANLSRLIEPIKYTFWGNIRFYFILLEAVLRFGFGGVKKVLTEGQGASENGLFYRGKSESESRIVLSKIVNKYLMGKSTVVFLDIHTGLGNYGVGEILVSAEEQSATVRDARLVWGDLVKSSFSKGAISSPVKGSIRSWLQQKLPGSKVVAGALEFGTYSQIRMYLSLRKENCLSHFCHNECQLLAARENLKKSFCPNNEKWKEMLWMQSKGVVSMALQYIKNE